MCKKGNDARENEDPARNQSGIVLQPVPVEAVQPFLGEVHPKGDAQHGNDGIEHAHCQDHHPAIGTRQQEVCLNLQAGRKKHHEYQ